ncbi:MAG: GNAT family N-acetyltransferase [Dehalococcoidia bacterium]|nr:GNAT family N-acetyltransferase [Dehalococcoidia bacterium]
MTAEPALTLTFVGPEQAEIVRELMLAAFAEYECPDRPVERDVGRPSRMSPGTLLSGAVLARLGSETVGSGRFELRDDHVYIGRLSVLPPHRGRGVAAAMMLAMEQRAAAAGFREARIGVRTLLPRNIALYERLGYVVTNRYQHPRGDEIIVDMAKALLPD